MVPPLQKVKVIHKHKGKFRRHQSDTNVRVPVRAVDVPLLLCICLFANTLSDGPCSDWTYHGAAPWFCGRNHGDVQRVSILGSEESLRDAASSCPTLVMAPTRSTGIFFPAVIIVTRIYTKKYRSHAFFSS
jgi:hypothetical protein